MGVKRVRTYNSPRRDAQANATRRAILAAAEELFTVHGYAAVTMERIARQARVSLATVYLYFPGKAALIAGMADELTAAPDLSVEQVERELTPIQQARIGVGIIRRLNERAWLTADILRSAHGSDPGLTAIWSVWQRRHLDAVRRGMTALHARESLRAGLDYDEAVDAFYAVAGTDVYRCLVRERGWTPDQYEAWLFRLACREWLGLPHDQVPTAAEGFEPDENGS